MSMNIYHLANKFILKASDDDIELTHMKLQKLVYYTYGYYLAIYKKSLIRGGIRIWQYGPVCKSLYKILCTRGNEPIKGILIKRGLSLPHFPPFFKKHKQCEKEDLIINRIWEVFGTYSDLQLSTMSHCKSSPWRTALDKGCRYGQRIPDKIIYEYFDGRLKESAELQERNRKNPTNLLVITGDCE